MRRLLDIFWPVIDSNMCCHLRCVASSGLGSRAILDCSGGDLGSHSDFWLPGLGLKVSAVQRTKHETLGPQTLGHEGTEAPSGFYDKPVGA